jgi:hypothetical protein
MVAAFIRALIRQGIPVIGVSCMVESDRTTWVIQYGPGATAQQMSTAEALKLTYDLTSDSALADEDAAREVDDLKLRAVAQALWECIPSPSMTKVQMRSRAIALWKQLRG